jgi:bifunctional N-acetylglucosamine-1-phosphate-uridyltransferase/glucosamine-1-phosphate-acetyltransferase GlmU-like protein
LGKTGLAVESVILAAGRGQRMEGVAKPFFKPLLEINGMPLIAYAAEYASAAGASSVTVVASSNNVDDIQRALTNYASWVSVVVQPAPNGPGDAALIGLHNATDSSIMLLMSDNIMNSAAVSQMATKAMIEDRDAVGVLHVPIEKASRFTRIQTASHGVHHFVEGSKIEPADESLPGMSTVWCGPIIFNREKATQVLQREKDKNSANTGELKIGPYLSEIIRKNALLTDVGAMDVGIPSVYTEQLKRKND